MNISYSYENANLLLVLLGMAVIIHFLVLRKTKKRTLYFSNYALLERILGNKVFHKNYLTLGIRLLILILLILAISDFRLFLTRDTTTYDYVLAIDNSPSMSMNFRDISGITMGFLGTLPKETGVGLVTFSKESYLVSDLTNDYRNIRKEIMNISVGAPPGTALSKALLTAGNILDKSGKDNKTIILITDGDIEDNLALDLNESLDSLQTKNITVFALGINNTEYYDNYDIPERLKNSVGSQPNGSVEIYRPSLDEETLILVANMTGGRYYNIAGNESLDTAFKDIISLRQQEVSLDARTYALALIGLLLFIEWALGATNLKTLP